MPRSQRQVPNVYFGKPGALVTLPWPQGGIDPTYDMPSAPFLTAQGMFQVSTLAQATRLYTVTWNGLHQDTYTRIEQYMLGMNGGGPWAFIDPSRANLLQPNQAASGGVFNDARQWATLTGAANEGAISASTTFLFRPGGSRVIRWFFNNVAATAPVLRFTSAYRNWFAVPAVPGLPYTFASRLRADGTVDSNITTGLRLRWLDAAGAQISETSGGDVAVLAAWQRLTVTGTAPANTAYVEPRYVATGSSIIVGASLYIDEPNLEQDSVANDWAPGTGVRPVKIVSMPEQVPFEARMRTGIALTMREIAP